MAKRVSKRRGRRAAEAEVEDVDTVAGELDGAPAPIVSSLGTAIESVRQALEPFDKATRKKIVRAASTVLD